MDETPHRISDKIDEVIENLNRKWQLELPFLHGMEARKAERGPQDTASHCVIQIRFLCFKSANFDSVLEDFDERARSVIAGWQFKPSQEKGTLPIYPKTKTFIRRDVLSKQGGQLTSQQREHIIGVLASVLNEEVKLTRESDVYERTTSNVTTRRQSLASTRTMSSVDAMEASRTASSATVIAASTVYASDLWDTTSHRKREAPVAEPIVTNKKTKPNEAQSKLDGFFQRSINNSQSSLHSMSTRSNHSRSNPPVPSFTTTAMERSFDTNPSSQADPVFTDEEPIPSSMDTSVLSSTLPASQDLLPSQDVDEMMNDVSFSSNLDCADATPAFSLRELSSTGPFRQPGNHLPSDLPFWQRWEIYRLSSITGLAPWTIQRDVNVACKTPSPKFDQLWSLLKTSYNNTGCGKLAQKSELRDWTHEKNMYENWKDGKSVYYSARLELQSFGDPLKFVLNPAKVDKSCRFHRHYGADRFMFVFMPYFTTDRLPKALRDRFKDKENEFHNIIMRWLSTQNHYIAGRVWRAYYLEPEKSQSKKKRDNEGQRQKLHLFAVDAPDFQAGAGHFLGRQHKSIPIEDFIQWHTPLDANRESSDLKLFARFGLGLSKTVATVVLQPAEFYDLPDLKNSLHGKVMNDGCALMSLELARAIWRECGNPSDDLPSAFQGRIGGAKGLWIVDYLGSRQPLSERGYWIEVSDSQLKIKPHPNERTDADPIQRTFEVLKYSKPCTVGGLNTQLINILEDRGVPRTVIEAALLQDLHEYIDTARHAMVDPRKLRAWVQQFHPIDRKAGYTAFKGGMPDSRIEEICLLVESGFEPNDCLHLRKLIRSMMTQELDTYVERLRIKIQHSTNVFCVSDPYGVLEPDEVHLGFSSEWENPDTRLKDNFLDNIDILVARNPAHLASDIQKRKVVYKRELRHFKNVVVFSTKGNVSTASMLSGGDYDGDTVTAIWDPKFTIPFQNVNMKSEPKSEQQCGMVNKSRGLIKVFEKSSPTVGELNSFLESCISFNAYPNPLGRCTNDFEKLIYNTGKLSGEGAKMLAALAGYLVDSSKQGWHITEKSYLGVRKQACGTIVQREPAYKSGEAPRQIVNAKGSQCQNVIDFLKFDVAQKQKDIALTDFKRLFEIDDSYDRQLSQNYHRENDRCMKTSKDPEKSAVVLVMDHLKTQLKHAAEQWSKDMSGLDEEKNSSEFTAIVLAVTSRILSIHPPDVDCDITRQFKSEGGDKGSRWSLLRASTMYYKWHGKSMLWHTVGDEICRIRARSKGVTRELIPSMHYILKADTKLVEKLTSLEENEFFEVV